MFKKILFAVAALLVVSAFADEAHALVDARFKRYSTEATMTAITALPGDVVGGYAEDTGALWLWSGSAWVQLASGSGLELTNGAVISNQTNNVVSVTENSEDITLTFASNSVTLASTTGATFTLTPATAITGDLTLNGGAGALTMTAASSSIVVTDASATGLVIGGATNPNQLQIDTQAGAEKLVVEGSTTAVAFHVDVGTALFDEGVAAATVATTLHTIRFCGNGSADGSATYMGPVLISDVKDATGGEQDAVDLSFGTAFCDGLDNSTEGTADRVWHSALAFKPVAMVCVGICTGATAANDAYTYQLRDDTADVTGMACTAAAFGGDATPAQCTVQDATPATVAAGSAIAIKMTGTDDACEAGGDDFECYVYVTF